MIPFLTYPLAMIALASLPALAAIYILRHRFRRRQVSSLVLWRFRVQSKEGGARVHRLQLPLLFFLELLALLLLVTAATGPHWKLAQSTKPLVVVLDDSFSMRAASGGIPVRDRAREALEKLYRFQPPPSTRLVLAGTEPRLLGSAGGRWADVEKLLEQWTCPAPGAALDAAVTLASEIGKEQMNILVLTDRAPAEEKISNDRLRWLSFGTPVENVALVNASRTANGEEDRCLIEVANFSASARAAELRVLAGSNVLHHSALSLAARGSQRLVFNLPRDVPALEAALTADALTEDDRAVLLPPIRKRVRVRVAVTNDVLAQLVNRTLDASGLRAAIAENPHLVIHHADAVGGTETWSLNWVIAPDAAAYTGPFVIDNSHPLTEGLALHGAVWAAGTLTNADAVPVIMAGNIPLLTVREDVIGREFLTLNLKPELSTLANTPDWPVLFWNLLDWRARQLPGLSEANARLGTEVVLKTTGDPVTVTWPDGTQKLFERPGGQLALDTPFSGLYSVAMGAATNWFSVNPLAAEESDLQPCVTGEWGQWRTDPDERREESPMAWLFALAALGILTAHLCLIARGKGGG